MARIIGGIGTTHVPAIGNAIAKGLQQDPYWKPFFSGFGRAHEWIARVRPDVVVVFYNDHGLNFFLDKLPSGRRASTSTPTRAGVCRSRALIPALLHCPGISSSRSSPTNSM
jgi:protocatechuate 4,5-dioxygenase, beta chain